MKSLEKSLESSGRCVLSLRGGRCPEPGGSGFAQAAGATGTGGALDSQVGPGCKSEQEPAGRGLPDRPGSACMASGGQSPNCSHSSTRWQGLASYRVILTPKHTLAQEARIAPVSPFCWDTLTIDGARGLPSPGKPWVMVPDRGVEGCEGAALSCWGGVGWAREEEPWPRVWREGGRLTAFIPTGARARAQAPGGGKEAVGDSPELPMGPGTGRGTGRGEDLRHEFPVLGPLQGQTPAPGQPPEPSARLFPAPVRVRF